MWLSSRAQVLTIRLGQKKSSSENRLNILQACVSSCNSDTIFRYLNVCCAVVFLAYLGARGAELQRPLGFIGWGKGPRALEICSCLSS